MIADGVGQEGECEGEGDKSASRRGGKGYSTEQCNVVRSVKNNLLSRSARLR